MAAIVAFFARITASAWLRAIGAGFNNVFGFIGRNPWPALCIALALFSALEWHEWGRFKADDLKARHALQLCQDGRKADRAAYVKAQADALAKAKLEKARLTNRYQAEKEKVQTDAQHDISAARAALDRYVRVHAQPAAPSAAGHAAAAGADPGADNASTVGRVPKLDGGGSVVVPEHDLEICTDNTVKLHAAQDYVQALHKVTSP